jgi:hypothetical protein
MVKAAEEYEFHDFNQAVRAPCGCADKFSIRFDSSDS